MELFTSALERPSQQDRPAAKPGRLSGRLAEIGAQATASQKARGPTTVSVDEPYHLNVYSHKHNMHMTFTNPNRDPIISYSAGNLGLRKAQRSTFDAAYQLAVYTMGKMQQSQWRVGGKKSGGQTQTFQNVERIEVVLRGYGPGREAFQKALLGPEGRLVKPKVVKVTDGTRLKFGGVRSPNVRRLG